MKQTSKQLDDLETERQKKIVFRSTMMMMMMMIMFWSTTTIDDDDDDDDGKQATKMRKKNQNSFLSPWYPRIDSDIFIYFYNKMSMSTRTEKKNFYSLCVITCFYSFVIFIQFVCVCVWLLSGTGDISHVHVSIHT